jgi:hypothetical protein
MQRHSHEDRLSQDRYQPGYGSDLGAGYRGSQDERAYRSGGSPGDYRSGLQDAQHSGYQTGGYQGGNYGNYQGGGYDRSQRGGYDRDDSPGGSYGRGYDHDRDDGRGFAFQNNDYDRNYGGYARGTGGGRDRYPGDRGPDMAHDRGGYGPPARDFGRGSQPYDDDRGRSPYNMYSRDADRGDGRRDFGRGDGGRQDFGRQDFGRGDFDRHERDRRSFDRGMMGGYTERGSYDHDRDAGRGGYGRDIDQSYQTGWRGAGRDGNFGRSEGRSRGGYDSAVHHNRDDEGRFAGELRWR